MTKTQCELKVLAFLKGKEDFKKIHWVQLEKCKGTVLVNGDPMPKKATVSRIADAVLTNLGL
jgi:hypothetical protein